MLMVNCLLRTFGLTDGFWLLMFLCLFSVFYFRSGTRRHLSEYTHFEAEMAFLTFDDLLNYLEDMVVDVAERLVARAGDLLKSVNPDFVRIPCFLSLFLFISDFDFCFWVSSTTYVPYVLSSNCAMMRRRVFAFEQVAPKKPFLRMDYSDAIKWLNDHNVYKDEEQKIPFELGDVRSLSTFLHRWFLCA
jgi:asparaginyl-tRNA synthetase